MSSTSRFLTGRGGLARFGAGFFLAASGAAKGVISEARLPRAGEAFGLLERFAICVDACGETFRQLLWQELTL